MSYGTEQSIGIIDQRAVLKRYFPWCPFIEYTQYSKCGITNEAQKTDAKKLSALVSYLFVCGLCVVLPDI